MIDLSLLRKYDRTGRNMSVQERWAYGASVMLISNTYGICIFMSFSIDIFLQKYPVENIISIAGC